LKTKPKISSEIGVFGISSSSVLCLSVTVSKRVRMGTRRASSCSDSHDH